MKKIINENSTRKQVLEAVKKNGYNLAYASDEFKSDLKVGVEAIKNTPRALEYASCKVQWLIRKDWGFDC